MEKADKLDDNEKQTCGKNLITHEQFVNQFLFIENLF